MFRDNWVRFGFGTALKPFSPTLPFVVDYTAAEPHPEGIRDPLKLAHEECWRVYMDNPRPLVLMVSGGVDSQAMAYAFKTAGVPFEAITARYNNGFNDYDFGSTSTFYQRHHIPVHVIRVDLLQFHFNELTDLAIRYQNHSPHFLTHIKIASMVREGTVISSGNIVNAQYPHMGTLDYSGFGLTRYAEISGKPVVGYFLNCNRHFVYEVSRLPTITSPDTAKDHYRAKCDLYHKAAFPVQPQPEKLHGFERLKDFFDTYPVSRAARFRFKSYPSRRPYDLLFRYPLQDAVRYSDDVATYLPKHG